MPNPKIISLCPSTTATLFDLGLGSAVAGRTKYCIHPQPHVEKIPVYGGTKNPDWDAIRTASPDFILFNKEENDISHLPMAREICETVDLTPVDIDTTIEMLKTYGRIFGVEQEANSYTGLIATAREKLQEQAERRGPFAYYYLIWHTPPMAAGPGTYIDALLQAAGGRNALPTNSERYPQVDIETMQKSPADIVLLSSEPYPFKEKHLSAYKDCGRSVQIIDGELCSWHGTWTLKGLKYLKDLEVTVGK